MGHAKLAIAVALVLAGIADSPEAHAKLRSNAIIGTGGPKANAIIGTGGPKANAIIGTGADAIIGTGRAKTAARSAIIGTGGPKANAIIGTGADAIIGTGGPKANAIIGTGADAIIGTGGPKANAIIGTGADAIIGTGGLKANAIIGTGRSKLLHVAPVDSVSVETGSIETLGKTFAVPDARSIEAAMASGRQVLVRITGTLKSNGAVTKAHMQVEPVDYVAGASRVLLVGRIDSVDATIGSIRIGKTNVQYSAAASNRDPRAGEMVAVIGVQPVRGGAVLAEEIDLR